MIIIISVILLPNSTKRNVRLNFYYRTITYVIDNNYTMCSILLPVVKVIDV